MPRKSLIAATQNTTGERDDARPSPTDSGTDEMTADAPAIRAEAPEDPMLSQTGTETDEFDAVEPGLQADIGENAPDSQTGAETEADGSVRCPSESGIALSANPDDVHPRTETETDEKSFGSATQGSLRADALPDSQTDFGDAVRDGILPIDDTKNPRKRGVRSRSGEDGENPPGTGQNPESAPKPARRRVRIEPVLAIDDERSVETWEDKLKNDLLDLIESQKGRRILSGTIHGVERSADNPNLSFAVIYHGAFKVIIPAEETVRPPEDFRDRSPADVMHYLMTKRLGAEIDFIVKGVDAGSGVAVASRLEAMALKRRQYYFGTDRDGNNLICEGLSAEARVVSVIRAGMFVDLFGLEVYIPLRELSYQRLSDASAHFRTGQRVLVKILKLDRSDEAIRVAASVKQAGENPYDRALNRYAPGNRYVGTVSMVDTNGVFVSLDGGIDCLCSHPKRGRPPRGARVTVRVIGVNRENNRIWGAITHMTVVR
jgi:hypothetical protein